MPSPMPSPMPCRRPFPSRRALHTPRCIIYPLEPLEHPGRQHRAPTCLAPTPAISSPLFPPPFRTNTRAPRGLPRKCVCRLSAPVVRYRIRNSYEVCTPYIHTYIHTIRMYEYVYIHTCLSVLREPVPWSVDQTLDLSRRRTPPRTPARPRTPTLPTRSPSHTGGV